MTPIPRYRQFSGPALFTAGFRPFFLGGAVWAAAAIPLWLLLYRGQFLLPTLLPPVTWHIHEMVYGYGAAVVAGFLLTAVPNWTGRLPLQGWPLIALFSTWVAGRCAVLTSGEIGAVAAAVIDLAFPVVFTATIAREVIVGQSWHNIAVVGGLAVFNIGNLLVHLEAVGLADTADLGNRLGIAILLTLISLIGGRIVPSFTTNWLKKARPDIPVPTAKDRLDLAAMIVVAAGLLIWAFLPAGHITPVTTLIAGLAAAARLARWRGYSSWGEPLVFILHVGYAWLAMGLLLVGLNGLHQFMLPSAALHALTVGAIGTMTLAVMTRASLGHTGRPLTATAATRVIYVLITLAALFRTTSPLLGERMDLMLDLAGAAWSAAFIVFAVSYGRYLARPRT
jgi:uncharacterized protein involved in response to NO